MYYTTRVHQSIEYFKWPKYTNTLIGPLAEETLQKVPENAEATRSGRGQTTLDAWPPADGCTDGTPNETIQCDTNFLTTLCGYDTNYNG